VDAGRAKGTRGNSERPGHDRPSAGAHRLATNSKAGASDKAGGGYTAQARCRLDDACAAGYLVGGASVSWASAPGSSTLPGRPGALPSEGVSKMCLKNVSHYNSGCLMPIQTLDVSPAGFLILRHSSDACGLQNAIGPHAMRVTPLIGVDRSYFSLTVNRTKSPYSHAGLMRFRADGPSQKKRRQNSLRFQNARPSARFV